MTLTPNAQRSLATIGIDGRNLDMIDGRLMADTTSIGDGVFLQEPTRLQLLPELMPSTLEANDAAADWVEWWRSAAGIPEGEIPEISLDAIGPPISIGALWSIGLSAEARAALLEVGVIDEAVETAHIHRGRMFVLTSSGLDWTWQATDWFVLLGISPDESVDMLRIALAQSLVSLIGVPGVAHVRILPRGLEITAEPPAPAAYAPERQLSWVVGEGLS